MIEKRLIDLSFIKGVYAYQRVVRYKLTYNQWENHGLLGFTGSETISCGPQVISYGDWEVPKEMEALFAPFKLTNLK